MAERKRLEAVQTVSAPILVIMLWTTIFTSAQIICKLSRGFPTGKIAEKAVRRSVLLCIYHCILDADSTKTLPSCVAFCSNFYRLG